LQQNLFQTLWNIKASSYKKWFEPYLRELKGTVENNIWHLNDDVYDHIIAVVRELLEALDFPFIKDPTRKVLLEEYLGRNMVSDRSFCTSLLVATLLHDIGKKKTLVTDRTGQTSCPEHEAEGAHIATKILADFESLNLPAFVRRTTKIIAEHTVPHIVFTPDVRLGERIDKFLQDYPDIAIELALLGYADTRGCQLEQLNPEEFKARMDAYHVFFNSSVLAIQSSLLGSMH